MPDQAEILQTIDAAVRGRVLVFGSLPPTGRDLDLLVRPADGAALASALSSAGFRACGTSWVRFEECSATVVELIPAAKLRLREEELHALFAEATPLPGLARIVEPAPHHTLLILARRLGRERRLPAKHRARLERALGQDPHAWERAAARAPGWNASESLGRLGRLHARPDHAQRPTWRALRRRPRRTRIVALSGTDPDRVKAHAEFLSETLRRLGFAVAVERPQPVGSTRSARPPVVAAGTLFSLWSPAWQHLGRGTVVVFDGSALGATRTATLAARMVRLLAPRPLRAYVLHEPTHGRPRHETAWPFGGRMLDADRSPDDVCAELAEDVWSALTQRGRGS